MKQLIVIAFLLGGCTATHDFVHQDHVDLRDLDSMAVDCEHPRAQMNFVRSQMTTPMQRYTNSFWVRNPVGVVASFFTGRYPYHRAVHDRQYDAVAKKLAWEIRHYCGGH